MNGNNQLVKHLYSYSSTKNNEVVMGTSEFPILRNDIDMKNAKLDLMKGYDSNLPQEYSEKYNPMYDAMIKNKSPETTLRDAFGGSKIVGWIGILEDLTLLSLNNSTKNNEVVMGASKFPILRNDIDMKNAKLYLMEGYDSNLSQEYFKKYNPMYDAMIKNKSPETTLRDALGGSKIVGWIGILEDLTLLSLNKFRGKTYRVYAQKHNGVIFLEKRPSDDNSKPAGEVKYMSQVEYMGHYFKHCMTTTPDESIKNDKLVDTTQGFYNAQTMDFNSKEFVLIKTCISAIDSTNSKFCNDKGIAYWACCYFGGIEEMVIGSKKCKGKNPRQTDVDVIQIKNADQLKDMCQIDTDVVMKYIADVFIRLNSQFDDPNVTSVDMLVGKEVVDFKSSSSDFIPLPEEIIAAFPKEG
uniref:Decapping nuclease n=1 Tax=Rhabditophanes sp. KR3021 TaxID=114890 RepID=A0AC35U1B1_9BILA